jgi:hypothetical protein
VIGGYIPEMKRTEFSNLKLFYNLHFVHFSVGHLLMIASTDEKKGPEFTRGPKL